MLQQEQSVADASFFYEMNNSLLKLEARGVVHLPEINHVYDGELHAFILA
jgi:hypothetical protein